MPERSGNFTFLQSEIVEQMCFEGMPLAWFAKLTFLATSFRHGIVLFVVRLCLLTPNRQADSFIIRLSKLKGTSSTVLLTFDSHMELWNRTKQRDILHRHVYSDPHFIAAEIITEMVEASWTKMLSTVDAVENCGSVKYGSLEVKLQDIATVKYGL
jgi:hypothetical protein